MARNKAKVASLKTAVATVFGKTPQGINKDLKALFLNYKIKDDSGDQYTIDGLSQFSITEQTTMRREQIAQQTGLSVDTVEIVQDIVATGNARKQEYWANLHEALALAEDGLEERKVATSSKGSGRMTWAKAVRGVVHFIADHAEAAKVAVDDIPDSELRLTSMKSVVGLRAAMQSRIESHSDDPVVTLRAEIYQLVGVNNEHDLRQWLKDQFDADQADVIDAWDFSNHTDLLTVQRIALDKQPQEA